MDEDAREEWLRDHQDGRVYPVGRALRSTFDADNHDSLDSDVTGLMIDLSKLPDPSGPVPSITPRPSESDARRSILARLTGFITRP